MRADRYDTLQPGACGPATTPRGQDMGDASAGAACRGEAAALRRAASGAPLAPYYPAAAA